MPGVAFIQHGNKVRWQLKLMEKNGNQTLRTSKFPDSLNILRANCGGWIENILYICGIPQEMPFWKTMKKNMDFVRLNWNKRP